MDFENFLMIISTQARKITIGQGQSEVYIRVPKVGI